MGLPFKLPLTTDTKFLCVGKIPVLTAKAIYPESDNDSEAQGFARAACQINHESELDRAIKAGMVTPLNPLSYEQHTFPFGDALRRAVISIEDFKRFAETFQIEVVIEDEPIESSQAIDDVTGLLNRNEVMAVFPVKADADANCKFWDGRLSSPSDQLKNARKSAGKRGTSALWEPLGIAHYLLGGGRMKCHMRLTQLDVVMNERFPKLADLWKEQTADAR